MVANWLLCDATVAPQQLDNAIALDITERISSRFFFRCIKPYFVVYSFFLFSPVFSIRTVKRASNKKNKLQLFCYLSEIAR